MKYSFPHSLYGQWATSNCQTQLCAWWLYYLLSDWRHKRKCREKTVIWKDRRMTKGWTLPFPKPVWKWFISAYLLPRHGFQCLRSPFSQKNYFFVKEIDVILQIEKFKTSSLRIRKWILPFKEKKPRKSFFLHHQRLWQWGQGTTWSIALLLSPCHFLLFLNT